MGKVGLGGEGSMEEPLGQGAMGQPTGAALGTGRGPAGSTVVFAFQSVCFFFPA